MINDKNSESDKMNTLVDVVLSECESIIAETENVTDSFTTEECDTLDSFLNEVYEIRCTAEELQSLVLDFDMKKNTKALKQEIDNLSITLYQNIKYTVEGFENEYESMMTTDLAVCFSSMRMAIDTIRNTIE